MHFATVIQPGIDPAQRRALLEVLQAFIQDRNQGFREEVRREAGGQRAAAAHLPRVGAACLGPDRRRATPGAAQLEAYNKQQPVFALVSGLGNASWRPIHEFSERFEVPCILPQADVPVLAERDFYTVYLSGA